MGSAANGTSLPPPGRWDSRLLNHTLRECNATRASGGVHVSLTSATER